MRKPLLQRRAVGVTPAKPVLRKRRRLTLAAERQARRHKISTASGPSRSDRSTRAAALPLNRGASLIVVLLLSLGLWAAIFGAAASLEIRGKVSRKSARSPSPRLATDIPRADSRAASSN